MSDITESNSIIGKKSYLFELKIIAIYKTLIAHKKEFVLSKQLLRCGTSIGANVHEAVGSESKETLFINFLSLLKKQRKLHIGCIF